MLLWWWLIYYMGWEIISIECYSRVGWKLASVGTIDEPWGSSKEKEVTLLCVHLNSSHLPPLVFPTLEDIESIFIFFIRHGEGLVAASTLKVSEGKGRTEKKKIGKKSLIEEAQMQSNTLARLQSKSRRRLAHAYVIYINTNPCSSLFSSLFCVCVRLVYKGLLAH